MAVLSAASVPFKNLLGGSFLEAERVQNKQPVEIAASKAAVSALLDYIYDGQPEVSVEVGLELLRLAEAYDLSGFTNEKRASSRRPRALSGTNLFLKVWLLALLCFSMFTPCHAVFCIDIMQLIQCSGQFMVASEDPILQFRLALLFVLLCTPVDYVSGTSKTSNSPSKAQTK